MSDTDENDSYTPGDTTVTAAEDTTSEGDTNNISDTNVSDSQQASDSNQLDTTEPDTIEPDTVDLSCQNPSDCADFINKCLIVTCENNSCQSTAKECEAAAQCKLFDHCDETTGECIYINDTDFTPCEDGNPCTADDNCRSGSCLGGDRPDDSEGDWIAYFSSNGEATVGPVDSNEERIAVVSYVNGQNITYDDSTQQSEATFLKDSNNVVLTQIGMDGTYLGSRSIGFLPSMVFDPDRRSARPRLGAVKIAGDNVVVGVPVSGVWDGVGVTTLPIFCGQQVRPDKDGYWVASFGENSCNWIIKIAEFTTSLFPYVNRVKVQPVGDSVYVGFNTIGNVPVVLHDGSPYTVIGSQNGLKMAVLLEFDANSGQLKSETRIEGVTEGHFGLTELASINDQLVATGLTSGQIGINGNIVPLPVEIDTSTGHLCIVSLGQTDFHWARVIGGEISSFSTINAQDGVIGNLAGGDIYTEDGPIALSGDIFLLDEQFTPSVKVGSWPHYRSDAIAAANHNYVIYGWINAEGEYDEYNNLTMYYFLNIGLFDYTLMRPGFTIDGDFDITFGPGGDFNYLALTNSNAIIAGIDQDSNSTYPGSMVLSLGTCMESPAQIGYFTITRANSHGELTCVGVDGDYSSTCGY